MTKTDEVPRTWLGYVEQGEWWRPNGRPWIRIAEMDPAWRYNASRWLDRQASAFLSNATHSMMVFLLVEKSQMSESTADAFEDQFERLIDAADDPARWIRGTTLYRALIEGLPTGRRKLDRLAERARHWSTCPARKDPAAVCACEQIKRQRELRPVCMITDCGCSGEAHP